jgi:hypothetical protein
MNYGYGNSFAQGAATGLRIIGGMVDLLERREDRERANKRADAKFNAWKEDRAYLKDKTRPRQEELGNIALEGKRLALRRGKEEFAEFEAGAENRGKSRAIEGRKFDVYANVINNPLYESSQLSALQTRVNQGEKSTLDLEKTRKTQAGDIAGINASNRGKVLDRDLKEQTQADRIRAIQAGADVAESNANVAYGIEDAQIASANAIAKAKESEANRAKDVPRYKLKSGGEITEAELFKQFKAGTRQGKDEMGMPVNIDIRTGKSITYTEWANERLVNPLPGTKSTSKKQKSLPKGMTKALESFITK